MPLFHCNECHHEWEGTKDMTTCSWCKGDSHILKEKTTLEVFIEKDLNRIVKQMKDGGPEDEQ